MLTSARDTAVEQGARADTWRIDASLARTLRAMGRRDEAERATRSARATVADLATELDDASVRETFVRGAERIVPPAAPLSPRRAAKARFGGLTTREREVARLIASGLSNRVIADRLILGERTVESYVANVLSKLAFTSRAQIAAWAVESGLLDTAG
jgi:DNA-binding NarL/FixJ family response regulator